MPDVGLFAAADPLPPEARVIIKYVVEVEGLPVYSETYDAEKLAAELEKDESRALELWARRLKCVIACRDRQAFSTSLTECIASGAICARGKDDELQVDARGLTASEHQD